MRHFWQWFCGYICICVRGRQVNRFLNLCSRNGIHLWRIRYYMNQEIHANLKFRDFYDLKPFLRKTKTKVKIISRKGFPFWCHRHPRLKWFFCFCFCLLCISIYSMNYVWNIQIKGNTEIATQEIIDYLQNNHVAIGQKKDSVDCSGIEIMLREQFQQLGWVSVYFEKTNLCIEIKESLYDVLEDSQIEPGKQYNLVANKDAKIYSVVIRRGKSNIEKEQHVKKGDVLVWGQNEIYDDSGAVKDVLHFKAEALIYADVVYELEIPLTELEIVSLRVAEAFDENTLLRYGYKKAGLFIENLESHGVLILNKKIIIQRKEKNIGFLVKIYAREQIGINIPVEEVLQHEFK